ncbi:rhamnan synthesis F family protein [Nocardioides sp. W7]|uniref:rhamnan synthesis F family protein n=1 Tax=Nocardioides sp. W7 TaxID=2931390 RepID=UPI001FD5E669|nr:rhamnan synthesis F family protein [Nocardioides sp. W7]
MATPERGRRLAVLAHFDPTGQLAPHVDRNIDALTATFDDVVVVTTAALAPDARERLRSRPVRLIERENVGYDFLSYQVGLASAGDLTAYDEVLICNDSFIGPLRSYDRLLDDMADDPADFWGLTASEQLRPHVQSYFTCFRAPVLADPEFQRFWAEMKPLSRRWKVVRRYEVGLSERLHQAGLRSAAYFRPSADDRRTARRRQAWAAALRVGAPRSRADLAELRDRGSRPWNPTIVLADRVLADARLPMVKLEVLRHDPFRLGADRLLDRCEQLFPEAFDGVRRHLELTAAHYPGRSEDVLPRRVVLSPLLGPVVRYR